MIYLNVILTVNVVLLALLLLPRITANLCMAAVYLKSLQKYWNREG